VESPTVKSAPASLLQLRDYQESLIQGIYERWKLGDKRVMAQMPTGAGKSCLFAAIARDLAAEGVLVIAHRQELIYQAQAHLQRWCDEPVGVIMAGCKPNPLFGIQVASIQTLMRRSLPKAGLVIIDESHHSISRTYKEVINAYPNAYILGVTATPCRADGTGFDDLFESLVCGPTVKQLIKAGHLSKYRMFADANPISTKGVKTTAGDFNQKQLANAVDAIALSGNLIDSYRQYADGKRNVVFAINVEHSQTIAERFNAAGIPAKHLDGTTPSEERKAALDAFRAGTIQVLSNCNLISEGFDLPAIECVQLARPTKSLSLFLQQVGRALRPADGKDHAVIIDHTKNWAIFGRPDRDRIWTLEGVQEEIKRKLKRKPDGEVVEEEEKPPIVEADAKLIEVDESIDEALQFEVAELDKLIEIAKAKGYKPGWVGYRFLELKPSYPALKACAVKLGYNPKWADWKWDKIVK
jgi:superfamily II DNA or RNA helicase